MDLNFTQGSVDASISGPQLVHLNTFLMDVLQSTTRHDLSGSEFLGQSFGTQSRYEKKGLYISKRNSNEQNLEALQRSILSLSTLSTSYTSSSMTGSFFAGVRFLSHHNEVLIE
jgi:hypothetical protein